MGGREVTRSLPAVHVIVLAAMTVMHVSSPPAVAATPAEAEQAEQHFASGVAALEGKRFKKAAEAFAKAYSLDPMPHSLWAMCRAEHKAEMLTEAKKHYEEFLAIKTLPEEFAAKMAEYRKDAAGYIVEIELKLNEEEQKKKLNAERRAIEEQKKKLEVERAAQVQRERSLRTDLLRKQREENKDDADTVPWLTVGVGGALLLAGAGMTIWNSSLASDMETEKDRVKYEELRSDKRTAETVSWVLYGLGGAAVVTGLILYSVMEPGPQPGVGEVEKVSVAPWWSAYGAGVLVGVGL